MRHLLGIALLTAACAATAGAAGPRVTFRSTQTQAGAVPPAWAFAGRFVVVADLGVGVRVYDAESGTRVRAIPVDGLSSVSDADVIATDGETVAVAAPGLGQVNLYDVADGTLVRSIAVPAAPEYRVALAGGRLLVGAPSSDTSANRAYLLDAATGAPLATYAPPDPGYRRFGESIRFVDDRVVAVASAPAPGSDALFVFQRDDPHALLDVVQSDGLAGGYPSQFVLVGDDLVASFGGNDLPDEGPITPSQVEMRSVHTGTLRWRRRGPTSTFGAALAAAGDDTILVSAAPEVGRSRLFQLDRRTGRILRTVAAGAHGDELGIGIVADATRALVGTFTNHDGFVIQLYDLSPCGSTACGDGITVQAAGRRGIDVRCPPMPRGGSCEAVALSSTDDAKALTSRARHAAAPGTGATLALAYNGIGRLLYGQAGHLTVQVAVTLRSRDGRVATHVVPVAVLP